MLAPNEIKKQLADVFERRQAQVLGELVDLHNTLVKASDFAELKAVITEATKASDVRMTRVEAAIERLDGSVARLAAAQVRTEDAMGRLSVEVGSLKNHFGFNLEEFTAALLPPYLLRHYGVHCAELERSFFVTGPGCEEEIDLVGEGTREGQPVTVLVECSARLGGSEVRRSAQKFERVAATLGERAVARVVVGMHIHPSAMAAAGELGLWLIPYSRINRERE